MKLIIQNNRIAATATDEYTGPDEFIDAPADFDVTRLGEYRYEDGALVLAPDTRITRLAFRNRFTSAEKMALELAALDDPTAPMTQRQQAADIARSGGRTAANLGPFERPDGGRSNGNICHCETSPSGTDESVRNGSA